MNNTNDYLYLELLMRSVTAFQAAVKGPVSDGEDREAPMIDDYLIVLKGQKMNLQGRVQGHPRLGTSFIQTSLLVHVTQDRKWARTLSRWYQLGDPKRLDAFQTSPDIDMDGFCLPTDTGGVGIPFRLARRILATQPARLAQIADEKGFDDVSETLSEFAESWPPKV